MLVAGNSFKAKGWKDALFLEHLKYYDNAFNGTWILKALDSSLITNLLLGA